MVEQGIDTIIAPFAEEVGKTLVALVKRQLNYLCCLNRNINSFNEAAKGLQDTRVDLQRQVDRERENGRQVSNQVETWLGDIDKLQIEETKIKNHISNVKRNCFSIMSRYSLSKKAKETAEAMMQLQKRRQELVDIAQDAAPPSKQPIPPGKTYEFRSRKQIEDDIVDAFKEGNIVVGIVGMGGLGKTIMAKRIKNRMMVENLVDEVVMVVVSQPVDMLKIQHQMGEQLSLKEIENQHTIDARAQKLHMRLKGAKQVLIVLDDVWKELDLDELGIPTKTDSGSCFVLLTSRNKDELTKMNAQVFGIPLVTDEEALSFFKEKSKISEKDKNLMPLAKEIVNECQGLPLALVTLGTTLKGREKRVWKDALRRLKDTNQTSVLERLRVSYDLLEEDEAKQLFLLCSLYPEDYSIEIEDLTFYGMGLQIFQNVDSLDQARNRVCSLITILKNCSLLLDAKEKDRVKMHDIIRDLAISIASKEKKVCKIDSKEQHDKNCEWILEFLESSSDSLGHLTGSNFSKLRLMVIHAESWSPLKSNVSSILKRKVNLNVLSLKYIQEFVELPKTLRILCLANCKLKFIFMVGMLSNLEVLKFTECDQIEELPIEIGKLRHLRLLDMSRCKNLQRIVSGIIKNLVKLEELKMLESFTGWESIRVNENEDMNVSLKELESLNNLTCLEIQISNLNLVEEQLQLPPSLETYKLLFGSFDNFPSNVEMYDRVVAFDGFHQEYDVGSWILTLARKAKGLYLYQNGPRNFDPLEAHSTIKILSVEDCTMFETLVRTSVVTIEGTFPMLEHLYLINLPNLIQIYDGPISKESNCFKNLRKLILDKLPSLTHVLENEDHNFSLSNLRRIKISNCDELRNLFSMKMATEVFSRLEKLEIENCAKMEEVLGNEGNREDGSGRDIVQFQSLKRLRLVNLPSLTTVGKDIKSIEFHVPISLNIKNCPKLTSLVPISQHNHDRDTFHWLCNNQVKFDRLQALGIVGGYDQPTNVWSQHISICFFTTLVGLEISSLSNIRALFSSSIANSFLTLNHVIIENCKNMERVIMDEKNFGEIEEEGKNIGGTTSHITFPKLNYLDLKNLESLTAFAGNEIGSISFPLLEYFNVDKCPKFNHMAIFSKNEERHDLHDDNKGESLHLFCNEKVKFDGLKWFWIVNNDLMVNLWCKHISTCLFTTLEKLFIYYLDNIKVLFSSSIANGLTTLKSLQISYCKNMKRVIMDKTDIQKNFDKIEEECEKDGGTTSHITFPNLVELDLVGLENLTTFGGHEIESIYFPLLKNLSIWNCPKFKHMVTSSKSEDGHNLHGDDNDESLYLFCNKKIKFGRLKEVDISLCNSIKNLFSTLIVEDLGNLQSLSITECQQVEAIITNRGQTNRNVVFTFPKLEILELRDLPLLAHAFDCAPQLPLLEELTIVGCPRMEFLTSNSVVNAPNLRQINLDDKTYEEETLNEMKDLNVFIHQHIMLQGKESTCYVYEDEHEDGDKIESKIGDHEMETPSQDSNGVMDSVVPTILPITTTGEQDKSSMLDLEMDKHFQTIVGKE